MGDHATPADRLRGQGESSTSNRRLFLAVTETPAPPNPLPPSLRILERLKDESPDIHFTGSIRVKNWGNSVAQDVSIRRSFGLGKDFEDKDILTAKPELGGPSLAAGEKRDELGQFEESTNKRGLPVDKFFARHRIPPGEMPYRSFDKIIVVVSYKNIFGEPKFIAECRAYVPNWMLTYPFNTILPKDSPMMKEKMILTHCE